MTLPAQPTIFSSHGNQISQYTRRPGSQAVTIRKPVVCNGLVFVSGQLSIDPHTGEKKLGSIEQQTEQALQNVAEILKAANSDLSQVLKTTVYISDINFWGAVNEVYARVMGEHRPARAVIPTGDLHYGFLIEIDAIAATYE